MAKSTTLYDRAGLSDSGNKKHKNDTSYSKPSEKALRFVLDYVKSTDVIKSKLIDTIVIVNN